MFPCALGSNPCLFQRWFIPSFVRCKQIPRSFLHHSNHHIELLLLFSLSVVSDSLRPHKATQQASLSLTICLNLLRLMSIKSIMQSKRLILCQPPSPALNLSQEQGIFQWVGSVSGGWSIRAPDSAAVLPTNIQSWFPLGLSDWSPCCPRDSRGVFSSTTVQKYQFFGA